ncbi:DNA polymerase [Thermoplasmatales archaeon]|nr:DNA polymerase [Thermoplasmatales archaeon]
MNEMKVKFRIVASSYRQRDITVELFGRTEDGKSVTALYFGFKPYFDIVAPSEAFMQTFRKNPEYVSEEDRKLWLYGSEKAVKRVFVKSPWKVPELRALTDSQTLSSDIPFHHRFIYDLDLASSVEVEGEELPDEKRRYSTDIVLRIDKISNTVPFNPELKILSFDIENSIQSGEIYVIGYAISMGNKTKKGEVSGKERDLLQNFVKLVCDEDPDVLTGYNIDGYDLPMIQERMAKNGVEFNIGRDFRKPNRVNNQYWRLHGRVISDTWWNVKKILHPKHETLNYVALELLGEGKDNINRLKIEEEWANRRQEVIDYCIKDSYLTLEIFKRMRVIDRNLFMSTVTKLPLDDVTNGGTSNYVDSILIRQADRENIGVPMTSHDLKENPIEGGYVHSIGAGLYDNVVVLDFKSMYPSMIMKYNICFTTFNPNGTIVAPTGARFLDPSKRIGLVPRILKTLMEERDKVKKDMKKAATEDEKNYLDGIQGALKILMNTFYGVLASSFYRFTNLEIGGAITAYARETITGLINLLKSEGKRVIYGDTDSIFIESGATTHEDAIRIGEDLSKRLSDKEGIIVEFEKVMDPFFSHGAKKRYAGKIVFPLEQNGTVLVRGYEVRRTDSFDLQSEALSKVFDYVLGKDVEGAQEYANNLVKMVSAGDPSISMEKLVISRSVRKFGEYKENMNLANVRVAKKLMDRGETFIPGMKVSWIVTNSKKSPQEVEPFIDGTKFDSVPDWNYYASRVRETLNRVLESLGDEMKILEPSNGSNGNGMATKSNTKATTLDEFMG